MSPKTRVPFLSEETEVEEPTTLEQRLEIAEREWQGWKQIAHEYWVEIQRLRVPATRSE